MSGEEGARQVEAVRKEEREGGVMRQVDEATWRMCGENRWFNAGIMFVLVQNGQRLSVDKQSNCRSTGTIGVCR